METTFILKNSVSQWCQGLYSSVIRTPFCLRVEWYLWRNIIYIFTDEEVFMIEMIVTLFHYFNVLVEGRETVEE